MEYLYVLDGDMDKVGGFHHIDLSLFSHTVGHNQSA